MNELELKRKRLELSKVRVAREELEFKVEERMEEIKRIQDAIEKQKTKEAELEKELSL